MADANHCEVHTGYVPTCLNCNMANPIQRNIGFDPVDTGHDPYNHVGIDVRPRYYPKLKSA